MQRLAGPRPLFTADRWRHIADARKDRPDRCGGHGVGPQEGASV